MSIPKSLTIVLVLLASHYLAFQIGQSQLYYKTAASTRKASQTPRGVYGVNQVLKFSPTRVDFGTVPDNEHQKRLISFTNTGSEPVEVSMTKASCSCTTARLVSDSKIPPGGKGTLEIGFQPALSAPEFSVSISVSYRGRPEIDRLLVSGRIDRK